MTDSSFETMAKKNTRAIAKRYVKKALAWALDNPRGEYEDYGDYVYRGIEEILGEK